MIRFSCPGCGATYSVDDSKGGKTGKCPKCQTQFQIPAPEEGAVASPPAPVAPPPPAYTPPPPPATDPNAPVEIAPCPGCQARLSVSNSDLGVDVECPYCKTVYKAVRAGATPPAPPPAPPRVSDLETAGSSRSSKRRDDDDDDDDRPKKRSRRDDDDDDDDRPSSRKRSSRRDDDDDDDDRPRKKKRRRGGNYEPHRGVMILMFGVLGWVVCVIFGIVAWTMGSADLRKMDEGTMDPEGRSMTRIGQILGMIQCIFLVIIIMIYCVIGIVGGVGGAGK